MSRLGKNRRSSESAFPKALMQKGARFRGLKLFLLSLVSGALCLSFLSLERNWNWFIASPMTFAEQIPIEWKNRDPDHRKELRYGYHYLFARNLKDFVPAGKRILLPPQALLIYNYCKGKSLNEMNYDFWDFSLDLLMLYHAQDYTLLHMGMEESKIRTADYALIEGPGDHPVRLIEINRELTMDQVLAKYEPYLEYPTKNWTKQDMYDLVQQIN